MLKQSEMVRKFRTVFDRQQSEVLAEVVTAAYTDLVKTSDFNELKSIVKELAEAQRRTEQRVEELAEAQKELAEAQRQTQVDIQTLTKRLGDLATTVGGIGNTLGYALENEAYRLLPALLKEKYGLEMTERFVRTYVGEVEINIFGKARRNGKEVLIVGETKTRLDERRAKKGLWEQLSKKIEAVKEMYPDIEIVPLIITHHARPGALKEAEEQGILVVQSFEW